MFLKSKGIRTSGHEIMKIGDEITTTSEVTTTEAVATVYKEKQEQMNVDRSVKARRFTWRIT